MGVVACKEKVRLGCGGYARARVEVLKDAVWQAVAAVGSGTSGGGVPEPGRGSSSSG